VECAEVLQAIPNRPKSALLAAGEVRAAFPTDDAVNRPFVRSCRKSGAHRWRLDFICDHTSASYSSFASIALIFAWRPRAPWSWRRSPCLSFRGGLPGRHRLEVAFAQLLLAALSPIDFRFSRMRSGPREIGPTQSQRLQRCVDLAQLLRVHR